MTRDSDVYDTGSSIGVLGKRVYSRALEISVIGFESEFEGIDFARSHNTHGAVPCLPEDILLVELETSDFVVLVIGAQFLHPQRLRLRIKASLVGVEVVRSPGHVREDEGE